jgi:phosphatidylglycerophosphatase A
VSVLVWIAQGFGVGRIPFAPGTFGSLVGLLWFALLVLPGKLWILLAGVLAGIGISIWLCGVGEKGLGQKDPGSVVMDEIIALPICFLSWVGIVLCRRGTMPGLQDFFVGDKLLLTAGVFVAFRVFDIAKPWPVRQSQSLPGGWGVTVDDVLAAAYVNLVTLVVFFVRGFVVA